MSKAQRPSDTGATVVLLSVFALGSLAYTIFFYPIRSLFERETPRYKQLKVLPLDRLCQELLDHGDYAWDPKEPKATERELQRVAMHITHQIAGMQFRTYPKDLTVEPENLISLLTSVMSESFHTHVNGNAEHERHRGIAIGFYIGVLVCLIAFYFEAIASMVGAALRSLFAF